MPDSLRMLFSHKNIVLDVINQVYELLSPEIKKFLKTCMLVPLKCPVNPYQEAHRKEVRRNKVYKPHPPHYVLVGGNGMDKGISDVIAGNGQRRYAEDIYPVGHPNRKLPYINLL